MKKPILFSVFLAVVFFLSACVEERGQSQSLQQTNDNASLGIKPGLRALSSPASYLIHTNGGIALGKINCVLSADRNVDCDDSFHYAGGNAVKIIAGYADKAQIFIVLESGNVLSHDSVAGEKYEYTGGDVADLAVGGNFYCFLTRNGNAPCFGVDDTHGQLRGYFGGDAVAVFAGQYGACVLTSSGGKNCWGAGTEFVSAYTGKILMPQDALMHP
ncbi:hypothetical protein HY249_01780 [Candidatus Azambacteria bacterium]|nr:hypothetical protein [Candidatus Azambacteria bacterium]